MSNPGGCEECTNDDLYEESIAFHLNLVKSPFAENTDVPGNRGRDFSKNFFRLRREASIIIIGLNYFLKHSRKGLITFVPPGATRQRP